MEVCGTDLFYGNNIAPAGRTDGNPQSDYTIAGRVSKSEQTQHEAGTYT